MWTLIIFLSFSPQKHQSLLIRSFENESACMEQGIKLSKHYLKHRAEVEYACEKLQ
jgi:hypothetical protein